MIANRLSTAEQRRPIVTNAALHAFARGGYHGTTVADIARAAGISSAYAFKLFPSKEHLFAAALDSCFAHVETALRNGAARSETDDPDDVLEEMGNAYALLIRDRDLLLLQVHAQAVAQIPDIGSALRAGLARITSLARELSGARDASVQRFMAYGQLCHLIVTTDIGNLPDDWARLLTAGIAHPA